MLLEPNFELLGRFSSGVFSCALGLHQLSVAVLSSHHWVDLWNAHAHLWDDLWGGEVSELSGRKLWLHVDFFR